jgi:predicted SprT family Zn-dependent metalloprotease
MPKSSRSHKHAARAPAITPIEYSGLQRAFEHFNSELFDGTLVNVMITYQRRSHSMGYFAPDRFAGRIEHGKQHELALNPDGFYGETDQAVCQTLVHEMVHLKQHLHGKPSAGGYHNREWAAMMKAVGLYPSNTGKPGGKETGAHMSDYVLADGAFAKAFTKLAAAGWRLNLQSAPRAGAKGGGNNSKTKFSCPKCRQNAWGKPDLSVRCDVCDLKMAV